MVKFCSQFLLSFLLCWALGAIETPKERLTKGSQLFNKGNYKAALQIIANIDVRRDLDNSDDMKLALKIRAIASSELGDQANALESIRELYFLDPAYRFDAFDTPNEVILLAREQLKMIEAQNQKLALIQPAEPEPALEPHPIIQEKIILVPAKPPFVTTLFPFGINHYLLHEPTKGTIYLSLQASTLALNIASFWWKQSYLSEFGSSQLANPRDKNSFHAAQIMQYVSIGAFALSLGASIVDAMINFAKNTHQNSELDNI